MVERHVDITRVRSNKITNSNEIQAISADITLLKNLLKTSIKKTKINDLISDYL